MKDSKGFTLLELIIAISLSAFVLIGVVTIAATMVRSQMDGIRSGTVTSWSVASYIAMAREIEDANVLAYPINDGDNADSLIVCKNWSRMMGPLPGAPMDASAPVSVIQYCVDSSDPDPTKARMRRYANIGMGVVCPSPGIPTACTAAPGGTWTETGIVGFRLEHLTGFPTVFLRDNSIGVRLRYAVGQQTATAGQPVVKFTPFNFGLSMQKQYSNNLD